MDRDSYLTSLAAETDLLVETAAATLDYPVPTCPGWTCERLIGHIGRVQRRTAAWVTTGAAGEVEQPPAGAAVAGWTRAGLAELVEALQAVDPDAQVATWSGTRPAGFWFRRMAVEAAVHRFDAQTATDHTTPLGTALAVDGIDELLTVLLPWRGTGDLGGTGETIHLHATDPELADAGAGEWLITLGAEGLAVERAHAKGDIAVRGTASDLLLLLWNRVGPDRFEIFGDRFVMDRWRGAVKV
jgi:uncharacterized protein (TIGR03083 family)